MPLIVPTPIIDPYSGGGGGVTPHTHPAVDITYVNTTSGLTAVDAQAAFDEIVSDSKYNVVTTVISYLMVPDDELILVKQTTPVTITLPAFPQEEKIYSVKDGSFNASTNPITISGNGFDVDGNPTFVIDSDGTSIDVVFDGTEFHII